MISARSTALTVGLLAIALVGVLATRDSGLDRVSAHLVGEPAPPLAGISITGDEWDLDAQRGRWVLVNFFSTTCLPCIVEHKELVAFSEGHPDDVRVVSVAFDDAARSVEEFFRTRGGDWPVLAARTGHVVVDWGVVAVPESYLVSPSGHVAAKVVGGIERDALETLFTELSGTVRP